MHMPYKIKKIIPKYLTMFRLLISPIIIILGFLKKYKIVFILGVLGIISDIFDNIIALKFNTESNKRKKLDILSTKIFIISFFISLIRKSLLYIPLFILELTICIIILLIFNYAKKEKILPIDKILNIFLYVLVTISLIFLLTNKVSFLVKGISYATINLELITISYYIVELLIQKKESSSLENLDIHKEIMMEQTIKLEKIKDLKEEDY